MVNILEPKARPCEEDWFYLLSSTTLIENNLLLGVGAMYHSLIQVLTAAKLIGRISGATISELEEKLGISRRSVYRILDALEELRYPYFKDEEHGNRYRLQDPGRPTSWWLPLPSVSFDLEDRVLLDFLFESAARDPALSQTVRKLREKLSLVGAAAGYAFAPKKSGAGETKPAAVLLKSSVASKASSPTVEQYFKILIEAATQRHTCEVSYESRESGDVKTYPINPLALFESEGGLYCYVVVPRHGSIIILALERIRELKTLDLVFTPPTGFDAEKRLADPFGIVQEESFSVLLYFSEEQAPYVRDRAWPDSYCFEELTNGKLSMSFETAGFFGLKRWILSWGVDVEVVKPEWLRKSVIEEIQGVSELYQTKE